MKRLFLLISFVCIILIGKTQQPFTHKSIIMYRFKNLNIILANESIIDSSTNVSHRYIQLPGTENVFEVYGPYLAMLITSQKEPLDSPVGHLSVDTSAKDGDMMKLENLQIMVTSKNDKVIQDWQDINKFYSSTDTTIFMPQVSRTIRLNPGTFYIPAREMMLANTLIQVTIRNKYSKAELIHFRFKGIGRPIAPFLTMWTQDSSSATNITSFVEQDMTQQLYSFAAYNNFYQNWSEKNSDKLKNENLHESSQLALYFRKPGPEYPDSSLEYRLRSESDTDTSWHKTGHQLLITHLKPGNHYTVQIRYSIHPADIREHTFYIVPRWYQTARNQIIIAISLALLFMFLLLLLYRRRIKKTKEKIERLNLEMRSLRSQLNPHFVFNAMSSIQGLINKREIDAANDYLTEFSRLLRESLNNNEKETVPISTETGLLNTYLKLEQLRFHFKYALSIEESINTNAVEIPTLLLQPILENAIKHGVSVLNEKGLIKVDITVTDHDLLVSVSDNGKGFTNDVPREGLGLKLTNERIRLINSTLIKQSVQMTIDSSADKGTIVHLVFKNWV